MLTNAKTSSPVRFEAVELDGCSESDPMIALSRELALAAESLPHGPGPKAPSAFGMEVGGGC